MRLNLRGRRTDAHRRSLTSYQSQERYPGTVGYSGASVHFNLLSSWLCTGELARFGSYNKIRPFVNSVSKSYARHQFLTTYFDPFYANLHLHPTKPEFIYDTNIFSFLRRASMDPSLLERLGIDGPMYQFKRSIADLVAQAQRYIWESWGASVNDQVRAWPPT